MGGRPEAPAPLRGPGILLGIGLGGFVDGILFHQILQWHHLLSSKGADSPDTVAGLETNTLADGLFHAFTWVAAAAGVWLLWRRTSDRRWAASGRALIGWTLVGWGLFNLVEGVVDHQILGLHHVREGAGHQTAYDLAFLAFGALLVLGGWLLVRSDIFRQQGLRTPPYHEMTHRRSEMGERAPNGESNEMPDSKPEAGDAAAGSAAEQAKEREREMEETGEENAA